MSVADLRRLVQRATPRVEDVRSPDRTDIIRRQHEHLPLREIVDALDALEFSPGSFLRLFREFQKEPVVSTPEEPMSDDTAVHQLFRLLEGLQVLCPTMPAPANGSASPEVTSEWAVSPEPGWQEEAAAAKSKGAECFKQKDFAAAIEHYTAAIKVTPSGGEGELHTLFSNRSAARLQVGAAEAALSDARTCVQLAPTWPKGRFREGSCLRQLGRLEEAATAFLAGQQLEPENKDWAKEAEKTDKLICAQTSSQVLQIVYQLLPDILAAWQRVGEDGVLQLQVNGDLAELGACKWRAIREGVKLGKAQIRYAFLRRNEYMANLAGNLQSSSPEGFATADLEGRPLKIPEITKFMEGSAKAVIHLDIKSGKDGKFKGILLTLPLEDGLKRFITKPKDPDPPKGSVDSVLKLQRNSGFPKSYPRYLGFQMFPGDLNFPVIDLLRDAPGSIES
eukprot:TRINITY_DN92136_c0_g1_i1.p1 TRINITY_DN92136_c0_g1~~TRINITY_DN92136_c0_g1_i1.p1  ORF type:complete len:472 (+),score=104.79 TRINITY_DN92136_c0_g1_i1:68-1417(+)